ncbi:MAG: type II secretion system protein [Gammaproteobacteria bacterium]|nr:type II secretion system protein [Gammaproteobacteria bacterium]
MNSRGQQGFTLLEVLVAFLLAALFLTVILSGFANGISSWKRTDNLAQAAMIAQSRLAEVGVLMPVAEGEHSGVTADDRVDFRWQVRMRPLQWEFASSLLDHGRVMYRVEVEVFWPSERGERSYRLETLRLQGVES